MDRFSLLLLEPGEIYFEDFKTVYHSRPEDRQPGVHSEIPGRLKVCSKSVVFVPQNHMLPMLKFPLADCDEIDEWSPKSFQSALASKRETVEMLKQNIIAPFKFRRSAEKFVFSFTYRKVGECLGQVQQLHRASTLPPAEQAGMVAAITYSRQARLSFDTCWLEHLGERLVLETVGSRISPLVVNPGRVLVTSERLYFQPYNNVEAAPVTKVKLDAVTRLRARRFLLRPQGLEVEYHDERGASRHISLWLGKPGDRDRVEQAMLEGGAGAGQHGTAGEGSDTMTLQWQHGIVSNYDYLMHLNSLADRSLADLTQYPVLPWVVADYTSPRLDLDRQETFRDLSKPVGALNQARLASLKARREEMVGPGREDGQTGYLYGSHYSCPGFILYYLVRRDPQLMLCLQNGRFDHPDRMFNSLAQTWRNVTTNSSDFKELVPEFYDTAAAEPGDFLLNKCISDMYERPQLEIDFGVRYTGDRVGNVTLPSWAASARDCVQQLRTALESPAVSRQLHSWINLVFGYQNCGEEAELADNVFYPLCYEGGVNLDSIADPAQRYALEVQISEFGQVPRQIFKTPHPARYTALPAQIHAGRAVPERRGAAGGPGWGRLGRVVRLGDHTQHKEGVTAVCVVGGQAVSAGQDGTVKLYRWEGQAGVERSLTAPSPLTISCLVSPVPATLLLSSWDNTVQCHSLVSGSWAVPLAAHQDAVSCLAWAANILATGSWDGRAKLWSSTQQNSFAVRLSDLQSELDCGAPVTCLDLELEESGAGSLATGTREGDVLVWSVAGGRASLALRLPSHARQVNALRLAGERLLSGGSDMAIKLWDLRTGSVVFSRQLVEEVLVLDWDGAVGVVGGGAGTLSTWDFSRGEQTASLAAHTGRLTALAVQRTKAGLLVVTGGEDRRVIVWEAETL